MKVLFAVHDEKVSLSIVKKYQKEYKEIISYKNVYYFNAILKEIQRDKSYDRIIIDEDLEEFTSTSYEEKDKFVFNKLDSITDEASNSNGKDIPIIIICTERRVKSEDILVKLFGIGIYNAIIGNDRSTDEVCRLINSPRSKKEAKAYYKIDSKNVEYGPEDENDVSEEEMQHILSYFKKLGKNTDKYDECFRKIASQYNEQQMKVIIAILPKNVKNILQDVSAEYQKFVPNSSVKNIKISKSRRKTTDETKPTSEKLLDSKTGSDKKQIVVPSAIEKNIIKKVTIKKPLSIKEYEDNVDDDEDDDDENFKEETQTTIVRRGRPSKKAISEMEELPKKRRGRPRKISEKEDQEENDNILPEMNNNYEDTLHGIDNEFEDTLPGIDNEFEDTLPGIDDEFEDTLPGIDDEFKDTLEEKEEDKKMVRREEFDNIDENLHRPEPIDDSLLRPEPISDDILPEIEDDDEFDEIETESETYNHNYEKSFEQKSYNSGFTNYQMPKRELQTFEQSYNDYDYTNYNSLLSSDRKVVAFVGTSKNGTSFIVNNIAKILSENGINTAILDATQNKNSYYIYNNNDDSLRNDAANSIENLIQGIPGGMKVSKNLSVYVEMPGQNSTKINQVGPILESLAKNHSATLIDCDFSTPLEYFANAQEIFLVQSLDVLTIQPLTAFLKELKNRDILEQQKIRIILNKSVKLRGITSRQIVGGMSRYNNPEMSMMTELFDRNFIVPIEIPFDTDVYAKYLEGLAECNISTNKYPKDFQNILNKLSNVIYPLLPARKSKENLTIDSQYSNGFSNNVNNTLNNMRKKY